MLTVIKANQRAIFYQNFISELLKVVKVLKIKVLFNFQDYGFHEFLLRHAWLPVDDM